LKELKPKERSGIMLFMSVYTYEPAQRAEVLERRQKEGFSLPEGAKLIGQWSYVSGGRTFTLIEVDDALTMAQLANRWNDLGKSEVFPVIETDELMKALAPNE
jgi:hypothetical protein